MADISSVVVGGVTYAIKDETARGMKPNIASVTLTAASWTGEGLFTQGVTLAGVTAQSKVDLQPTADQIMQLINDGVQALNIANNNGSLTAYAVGAAPTANMTIQVTVTEVNT